MYSGTYVGLSLFSKAWKSVSAVSAYRELSNVVLFFVQTFYGNVQDPTFTIT